MKVCKHESELAENQWSKMLLIYPVQAVKLLLLNFLKKRIRLIRLNLGHALLTEKMVMGSSALLLCIFTPPLNEILLTEILCGEEAESKDRNAILASIEDVELKYPQYLFLSWFS